MAKGRKLTTSRSDRLLGGYRYGNSHDRDGGDDNGGMEFGEEDVWSMVDDVVNGGADHRHSINGEWSSRASVEGNGRNRHCPAAPRGDGYAGGLSLAFEEIPPAGKVAASPRIVHQFRNGGDSLASPRARHVATSAPVNVPDWSKIYRVDSVESIHELDDGPDDQDTDMVPPHEYLAREYARSRKSAANSVFEGVGRTLKGRDMSRVRDAVWSQTGFDG